MSRSTRRQCWRRCSSEPRTLFAPPRPDDGTGYSVGGRHRNSLICRPEEHVALPAEAQQLLHWRHSGNFGSRRSDDPPSRRSKCRGQSQPGRLWLPRTARKITNNAASAARKGAATGRVLQASAMATTRSTCSINTAYRTMPSLPTSQDRALDASRIAALVRRPSGRFADFSEIGVHTCLCLKLVGGKGCGASADASRRFGPLTRDVRPSVTTTITMCH